MGENGEERMGKGRRKGPTGPARRRVVCTGVCRDEETLSLFFFFEEDDNVPRLLYTTSYMRGYGNEKVYIVMQHSLLHLQALARSLARVIRYSVTFLFDANFFGLLSSLPFDISHHSSLLHLHSSLPDFGSV